MDETTRTRIRKHLIDAQGHLEQALHDIDQALGCDNGLALGRSNVAAALASVQARLCELGRV